MLKSIYLLKSVEFIANYQTNKNEIFQPKYPILHWRSVVKLSQLKAESDVVQILNIISPEGDGIPGLQSHVERPGTL